MVRTPSESLFRSQGNASETLLSYIYPDQLVDLYYTVIHLRPTQAVLFGEVQDGKPRLLGYVSKSLPEACTEL